MNTEKMFETASREKLRFQTNKGVVTVEELWEFSLTSLDNIAKGVNKELQSLSEDSFIPNKATRANKAQKLSELALEILKHVITVKVEEAESAKLRAEKTAKSARIRELMAQKKEQELSEKSMDELEALLKEVEG